MAGAVHAVQADRNTSRVPTVAIDIVRPKVDHMTVDEAVAAVSATLSSPALRVDRKRVHEDTESYVVIVLDASDGDEAGPVDNGPRLVNKRSGEVTRLTVPDALRRTASMTRAG
jgi:hypothetical protein